MNNHRYSNYRQVSVAIPVAFFRLALFLRCMISATSLLANDGRYIITDPPVQQGSSEKESILRIGYSWIWQP